MQSTLRHHACDASEQIYEVPLSDAVCPHALQLWGAMTTRVHVVHWYLSWLTDAYQCQALLIC